MSVHIMLRHMSRQDVLQEYFVEGPHRLHLISLHQEFGLPLKVQLPCVLRLTIQNVKENAQNDHVESGLSCCADLNADNGEIVSEHYENGV